MATISVPLNEISGSRTGSSSYDGAFLSAEQAACNSADNSADYGAFSSAVVMATVAPNLRPGVRDKASQQKCRQQRGYHKPTESLSNHHDYLLWKSPIKNRGKASGVLPTLDHPPFVAASRREYTTNASLSLIRRTRPDL